MLCPPPLQHEEVAQLGGYEWVAWRGHSRLRCGLFVAQVVGESMNKRISNGAWRVWRLEPGSDANGTEVVLAQHRTVNDPALGGQCAVELYEKKQPVLVDGAVEVERITLRPCSDDWSFEPIVLAGGGLAELRVIAELVEVLR